MRFGIIGTGRISSWVLEGALKEPRFVPSAVASRSLERARDFAEKWNIPKAYGSVREMLSDPDIDAVYIGTPNDTHASLAIECMKAGKHVLCEKPLGLDPGEISAMAETASENRVVLMEAMISTLNPNFQKLKSLLPSVGKVRMVSSVFCQYSSKYDAVLKMKESGDYSSLPSSFDPRHGGGALSDIGIYTIYPIVALFGKPLNVRSSSLYLDIGGCPVDIQGSAILSYDGMNATLSYSKVADSFGTFEIAGERGTLILDAIHIGRRLTFIPHGKPSSGRGPAPGSESWELPFPDEYTPEISHFIDRVESGDILESDDSLENSLITAQVMELIRRDGFKTEMQNRLGLCSAQG